MRNAAAGALLALVVLLAFWPVASGARSFLHWDLRYEHVPIWTATQKALRSGESPWWIEGEYCGNPLLFHQEAPLFYPLTAPLLLTGAPAHRLADLFSLFHFWLAGFAAYLLLRDRGAGSPAALFGGVAWMLCGRMIQSAIWPNAVAVQALLPLLLLGMFRIGEGRRRSGILVASVSGGLCLLAARPHSLVGAAPLFLSVGLALVLFAKQKWPTVRDLAIAGVLAAALGAPSLLPSAVLLPDSSRSGGLARAERDLNPLASSGELDQVFLPTDGPGRWPEAAAYPGVLAAFLFVVGITLTLRRSEGPTRRAFWALAAGGLIGLLFAFGEHGPLRLVADLPPLKGFRVPARYLTSWSLAVALGSAFVLSRLLRDSAGQRVIAAACLVGLSFDLTIHARRAAPTAPSSVYETEPDLLPVMRRLLAPDGVGVPRRVWSLVVPPFLWTYPDAEMLVAAKKYEPLYGALGMSYGLESVSGNGPSLRRWKLLFGGRSVRLAELAGVGALVLPAEGSAAPEIGSPQPMLVQRFPGFPRAIVVPEAVVVPPSGAIAAVLDEKLDPRSTVVLEEGSALAKDPRWDPAKGSVRLLARAPGRMSLRANLPADGVLVVFNSFERGWQARVDGAAARVLPADGAFQGVRLTAGDHVVELRYRPRGLLAGLALGVAGLLGTIFAAVRIRDA
ncbi:MAG TPA: YfhO family protein [Thermoanaerobaculia bacterium]